jgi:hypothetical protein
MNTSAAAAENFINCLRRRRRWLENLKNFSVIGGGGGGGSAARLASLIGTRREVTDRIRSSYSSRFGICPTRSEVSSLTWDIVNSCLIYKEIYSLVRHLKIWNLIRSSNQQAVRSVNSKKRKDLRVSSEDEVLTTMRTTENNNEEERMSINSKENKNLLFWLFLSWLF